MKNVCKPYHRFPDKELHGTYSLDGNHQQHSRRSIVYHRPQEAGPNSCSGNRTLTKQNHDLKEQLHQKNAALDTQDEDQEGISIERRNQEGPKGSNTPSRQKRLDTSHPSVVDVVPPHMVAEMQMMKERMDVMMNALRGRVLRNLDELVHRTDSPFTTPVTSFSLPPKFRMPQVETYDGSKDPLDHLESFKTLMHLQGVVDEIMCRTFPTTLKGPTRIWFSRLMPNSIGTFKELSA